MAWIVCFLLTLGPWSTSTQQLCPSAEFVSTFSSEDVKSGLQGLSCLDSLSTNAKCPGGSLPYIVKATRAF